jgi:hypothetical protein
MKGRYLLGKAVPESDYQQYVKRVKRQAEDEELKVKMPSERPVIKAEKKVVNKFKAKKEPKVIKNQAQSDKLKEVQKIKKEKGISLAEAWAVFKKKD